MEGDLQNTRGIVGAQVPIEDVKEETAVVSKPDDRTIREKSRKSKKSQKFDKCEWHKNIKLFKF